MSGQIINSIFTILTITSQISTHYVIPTYQRKHNLKRIQKLKLTTPIECALRCKIRKECHTSAIDGKSCLLFKKILTVTDPSSHIFLSGLENGTGIHFPNLYQPKRGTIYGHIPTLQRAWFVSFNVVINSIIREWSNMIHFTVGNDNSVNGDRTPGVWFNPATAKLHISSSVNSDSNFMYNHPTALLLGVPTNIRILQTLVNGLYHYMIYIDHQIVCDVVNRTPRVFNNVVVYMSDPWYTAADVLVKNFQYGNE